MNRWYLMIIAAVLFLGADSRLSAQTPVSPPPTRDEAADTTLEIFELTEAEMPGYDEHELASGVVYPVLARNNNMEGDVHVSFIVDVDGRAKQIEFVESTSLIFNAPAVEAVRKVRFKPAIRKGKAVRVRMALPVRFRLSP